MDLGCVLGQAIADCILKSVFVTREARLVEKVILISFATSDSTVQECSGKSYACSVCTLRKRKALGGFPGWKGDKYGWKEKRSAVFDDYLHAQGIGGHGA